VRYLQRDNIVSMADNICNIMLNEGTLQDGELCRAAEVRLVVKTRGGKRTPWLPRAIYIQLGTRNEVRRDIKSGVSKVCKVC
jgi:hypothetical protein